MTTVGVVDNERNPLFELSPGSTDIQAKRELIRRIPVLTQEMIRIIDLPPNKFQLQTIFDVLKKLKITNQKQLSKDKKAIQLINSIFPDLDDKLLSDAFSIINFVPKTDGVVDFHIIRGTIYWDHGKKINIPLKKIIDGIEMNKTIPFLFTKYNGNLVVKFWDVLNEQAQNDIKQWIKKEEARRQSKEEPDNITLRVATHKNKLRPEQTGYSLLKIENVSGNIKLMLSFSFEEAGSHTDIAGIVENVNSVIKQINKIGRISIPIPKPKRLPINVDTKYYSQILFNVSLPKLAVFQEAVDKNKIFSLKGDFVIQNENTIIKIQKSESDPMKSLITMENSPSISRTNKLFLELENVFRDIQTKQNNEISKFEPPFLQRMPNNISETVQIESFDSETILQEGQVGKIAKPLNDIFQDFIRLGVDTKHSFLNCISVALNLGRSADKIKTDMDLFLNSNPDFFKTINDGELAFEFKSLDSYRKFIKSSYTFEYKYIIDVISRMYRVNIFVFDSRKNNVKCDSQISEINVKTVFILSKTPTRYELICQLNPVSGILTKSFLSGSDIARNVSQIYNVSCLLTPQFPGFSKTPPTLFDLIRSQLAIRKQVVNAFNKVMFVVLENDVVLPVVPSGPEENIDTITVENVAFNDLTQSHLKILFSLPPELAYTPVAQVLGDSGGIKHLVLESGLVLPVNSGRRIAGMPTSLMEYSPEIDTFLASGEKENDLRVVASEEYEYNQAVLEQLKNDLTYILKHKEVLRQEIISVVFDRRLSRTQKTIMIEELLDPIFEDLRVSDFRRPLKLSKKRIPCPSFKDKSSCLTNTICAFENDKCRISVDVRNYDSFKSWIINNLLTDVKDQDILSGKGIASLETEDEKLVKRPGETILIGLNDIRKFLTNVI